MNVLLLCVGKLKEPFLRDGCAEYQKRLGHYCKLAIQEINDEPDGARAAQREGERIVSALRPTDRVVLLAIRGQEYDSESFAAQLDKWDGGERLVFIIGGSQGVSADVEKRADARLSFSKLTFPHGLMRLVFLEQLYRAYKIRSGEKYHK